MASKEVLKIAGLKLSVEGAAQFQTSLKSINSQMKLSSAELQKVTAQYGKNSTATGALTAKKKALEDKLKSQRQVTTQLNSVLKETEQRYGENSEEATRMRAKVLESEAAEERLKTQLKAVTLELAKQSSKAVQLGQKLQTVGEKMKGVGTKMKTLGSNMTKFVTVPILAAGAGLFKLAENFEKAERVIRVGTGATGDALKGLQDDFEAVYGSVPSSMEDASVAIADLNTRLGLTGKPLQNMAEQMLNLSRITNVDVSTAIKASTRMFKDAGIAQEDYADALDYTFRVSQSTGIGIDRLQELMVQFGGPLRQMGFDWQEAAAMLGKFEQEGVNTELVVGSLRIALGKMAKEGIKDPPKALAEITKRIKEAGSAGEANAIALEVFGSRAGPDMAAAIREGRLDFDKLLTSLKNGKDTINGAAKETETFSEKFQLLKNKLALALKPLAGEFMKTLEDLIPTIVDVVKGIGDLIKGFNNLSPETKKLILMAVGLSAALGPVVRVMGSVTSAAGSLTKGVGKIIEKFGASHAAAAAASAGLGSVSSAATGASTAAAGATTATAGLSGSMLGVLAPAGLLVGAAIAIGTAIDNATTTTDEFSREMTSAFENFAADVATANGVMEVFVSDTTASGKAVETVRDKINKVEGQIVSAYKAYMADKGAERDKDLADIREYNAELRELMLDEMSAYGTAQQVLADQLRLGTIEVTKENLADVVKSIGEAETQANDAADKIYEEQARYVLMNKDLTQEQKDDQLRKLAETRDEGKKIAKQMAADSAYYARLQMESNDKNLAQQLKTVRNYGSKMTTAEKDFAREYQEISNRKYTDETQRSRDLQALGLRYARSQQENAQLISDAWLSVDEDTRATWINLINAEAKGGRTLSTNTRQTVDALMRMYASMPGGLKNVGEDMMVALGRAIINEKSPERAANATKKDCVNAFKNAYGEYEEAGIKSMNEAAVGIKKGKPGVKTEAGKTKDVAVGEFRKLESAAESSGKSGIQGLIRGVRNPTLRNILYWAARALAQKANQGIRDGIQTGSPSKLWTKFGKWAGEGLVKGIAGEEQHVMQAARNLASAANVGVVSGVEKPSVEKPKSAPANVEAMIERGIEKAMSRVTVELDKRQVGRLVVLREV